MNGVGKEHCEVLWNDRHLFQLDGRKPDRFVSCGTIANWLFSVKSAWRALIFVNQEFIHNRFVQFNSQPGAGRNGDLSVYQWRKIGDKFPHQG